MKYLIMALLLLSAQSFAFDNDSDDELVCAKLSDYGRNEKSNAISCVSKASIELDRAQLKLVKMQIRKLEAEIKLMEEMGQLPTPKKSK